MIIEVNNKTFRGIEDYTITQKFNSIASTFSLTTNKTLSENYLDFPICRIYTNENRLLLTGRLFAPTKASEAKPTPYNYVGYSLPGILEDCTIPVESYPLQFDNLSLLEITDKLLAPFDLGYSIIGDVIDDLNKKYKKESADPETTIKQFINDLASQRNIYLSNDESGQIIFTRYNEKTFLPTLYLEEGKPGLKRVYININTQALHSQITVVRQATKENEDAAEYTIQNPYMESFRPITRTLNSEENFDIDKAARNILSSELSNIRFNISTTKYAKPGTTLMLKAPSLNINRSTEIFIEQTVIKGTTSDTDIYEMECVLVDVYTNSKVKNIFK